MVFDSMGELEAYVLKIMDNCAEICAEEMLEIMENEINNQVYNGYSPNMYVRTMELLRTPTKISADRSGMHTRFEDNGGWYSLRGSAKGQHFLPFYGLEEDLHSTGGTWGRGSTDVIGQSDEMCKMNIPMKYKEAMRAFGIPIV